MSKNITLSLPDDMVRRAKVAAAERDMSVSGLVGELLQRMLGSRDDYDSVWANEEAVMSDGILQVGDITWDRDSLHART